MKGGTCGARRTQAEEKEWHRWSVLAQVSALWPSIKRCEWVSAPWPSIRRFLWKLLKYLIVWMRVIVCCHIESVPRLSLQDQNWLTTYLSSLSATGNTDWIINQLMFYLCNEVNNNKLKSVIVKPITYSSGKMCRENCWISQGLAGSFTALRGLCSPSASYTLY